MNDGSHARRSQAHAAAHGPRRLAEWVTFGLSLGLVLALVAYLGWRLREPVSEIVEARVHVQLDGVVQREGRFILPIQVDNQSSRAVRDLSLRVDYRGASGARESLDILIDYVGQASEQTVYTYFDQDPHALSVRATPRSYRVE